MRTKVTKELKEEVVELYKNTSFTQKEIALKYDIHKNTVCKILKEANITKEDKKPLEEAAAAKRAIYLLISEEEKAKLNILSKVNYITITSFFKKCINEEYKKLLSI